MTEPMVTEGNLLKVKQLTTGYTGLVVYEQYPGDI